MSFATGADLYTSIANHIDRSDLTSVIPDFVALFEANANAETTFRTRFNLTTATLTTTIGTESIALPSDFQEANTLINTTVSGGGYAPVPVLTVAALYTTWPSSTTGEPKNFAAVGSNLILRPVPDLAYTLKLYYYTKVTALTSSTSNFLLQNFPNAYLYGSLVAAEAYLGSDPRIATWGNLYDNFMTKLDTSNERGLYGSAPLKMSFELNNVV